MNSAKCESKRLSAEREAGTTCTGQVTWHVPLGWSGMLQLGVQGTTGTYQSLPVMSSTAGGFVLFGLVYGAAGGVLKGSAGASFQPPRPPPPPPPWPFGSPARGVL